MRSFTYTASPTRVVFGAGTISQLADEVERLRCSRVLLLASPRLGEIDLPSVARFEGAVMHTPVEVTEKALALLREHSADCVVAVGGGSTTGLAKALALRTGVPQIIVPTTYAGSEVTPVLGETRDGKKTTQSSPEILPETVIYDVELTRSLPVPLSVTSGINALAHAVEALYSPQANPVVDAMALRAISGISHALPLIAADPSTMDARAELLESAWLAGTCLASTSTGLHHKLAHLLGGTYKLPHSETHTVLLPHTLALHATTDPEITRRIATALGVHDAPGGLYDLIVSLGGPTSLQELGLAAADLPDQEQIRQAWVGNRPGSSLSRLTDQVVASFADAPDPRVRQLLTNLVRLLHDFVVDNDLTDAEWAYGIDFLTRTGQISSDVRQEFVLLSDTLGVSSMVDLLTNSRTPGTTPSAVLGPFYVDGPPEAEQGADISDGLPGIPLRAKIQVTDLDGAPVPDAVVDVWQSNKDGYYDVQLPELDGPVLRARFRTDAEGRLRFSSILPSAYPIPDDGPVGRMLTAVGRHPYRAPHIHFMISAPGFQRLVTQLFVAGGEYLDSDTVFGVKEPLIVDFPAQGDDDQRRLEFTFQIARQVP